MAAYALQEEHQWVLVWEKLSVFNCMMLDVNLEVFSGQEQEEFLHGQREEQLWRDQRRLRVHVAREGLKPGFHYPSTRLVETRARVMETGHLSTWAVNSGRQLG